MRGRKWVRKGSRRGNILLAVLVISAVLWLALASTMVYVNDARRMEVRRIENDNAFQVAEGGLAQGVSWFVTREVAPDAETAIAEEDLIIADGYNLDVRVYPQNDGIREFFTIVSTATFNPGGPDQFHRRVQASIIRENFARYEHFVDYGPVWSSGLLHFYGFNRVYFGPVHSNSGVGFWPNLWFLSEFTTAVSGDPPARVYNNYNDYVSGVYQNNSAINYVNILKYYNNTYKHEPKFYDGWRVLDAPIELPDVADTRAQNLRDSAGLVLPADYPSYDSTKGPNFSVELVDPTNANGDGVIKVKQYRGKAQNNKPIYGPEVTYNISDINNAMVVYGDVVSLKGRLDGRLTIGAFRKGASQDGSGKIQISGSLEYESRLNYEDNFGEEFLYSDAPNLYTNEGADVNKQFVSTLKEQVMRLDDMLGLVSEADVVVVERDLEGFRVANGHGNPIWLDAIVMATGTSTSSGSDGSYYPENARQRPVGTAHRLGGSIQERAGSWALFSGGNHTAGLTGPSLYDFRSAFPNGAPPYFPTTGNFEYVPDSWRETFVANAEDTPWLPIEVE